MPPKSQPWSPPTWLVLWLMVSAVLMVYDALYVLLRPRTTRGGDLFKFWSAYELYAGVDRLYSVEVLNSGDGFCAAQSWCNLVEVACQLAAVYLWRHGSGAKGRLGAQAGDLLAFGCQLMTLWKTILYNANDLLRPKGMRYTDTDAPLSRYLLVFLLPTSFWIVCPALAVWVLGKHVLGVLAQRAGTAASTRTGAKASK